MFGMQQKDVKMSVLLLNIKHEFNEIEEHNVSTFQQSNHL